MKQATLRRTEMGDAGTFGVLEVDGHTFHTGELPWRDNRRGKSCVPAGTYIVKWDPSPRFGHKYELFGVPGRTTILIHEANFVGDEDLGFQAEVDGCIALGSALGVIDGQQAVTGSKKAVKRFEELLAHEPFELTIIDEYLEAGEIPGNVA